MASIRDDEPVSMADFKTLLRQLGFKTQAEAAEALGITQGYVSLLTAGKKQVLPATPTHKLLQALIREQRLQQQLRRLERKDAGTAG